MTSSTLSEHRFKLCDQFDASLRRKGIEITLTPLYGRERGCCWHAEELPIRLPAFEGNLFIGHTLRGIAMINLDDCRSAQCSHDRRREARQLSRRLDCDGGDHSLRLSRHGGSVRFRSVRQARRSSAVGKPRGEAALLQAATLFEPLLALDRLPPIDPKPDDLKPGVVPPTT
jgi:hypothetical protein